MKTINTIVFCFLLCCVVHSKLKMMIEVFRHGAREPIYDFWDAKSYKNPGELTNVGMRQHFLLGAQLRREYITELNFLSPYYNPNEIYIR